MINRTGWIMRAGGIAFILLGSVLSDAQVFHPEGGFVYDDTGLPRIEMTMAPSDLESLYANPESDKEYPAYFKFTRNAVMEELPDVGIRFRGNTSRGKDKKSFRLSFNTFEGGREFHGLEKMNLNAETNDPSMVRSKLSWELFRQLGIAGCRSNHVLLYINGEFYGVYINTEHIDEKFIRSRFGTNDGNMYKCLWPADLAYLGPDQDDYKSEYGGRRAYELKINEEWDDYKDLAHLINVIEQFSATEFMEELEKVMNVQQYLKIMAVDVMTGNWDGYIGNKNNYYLYRDPGSGRFEYVAYDLDNTFGIDWLGEDWSSRSIYNWHRESRPLYEKILQQGIYRRQYTAYIRKLAAYMTSGPLKEEVERWQDQIRNWVSQDPFYPLDWGYDFADFETSLVTGSGDHSHIWFGVLEFAALRAASALQECNQDDAPPLISHARLIPSPGVIRVDWTVEDDASGFTTALHYRIDEGGWQTVGQTGASLTDPVSGISTFRDSITGVSGNARVDLYFTAADNAAQETRYPAGQVSVSYPLANGPLLINEFMASNTRFYPDEFGEYDDWLEIYNPTGAAVWLGDLFLSDNVGKPGKFRFPDVTLGPQSFYVVWLDGQPGQGARHAPFRLSRDGEELRLSGRPAEGYPIMDSLTFGPQAVDVAQGRANDGELGWLAFSRPTPGFSNRFTSSGEFLAEQPSPFLYPNPVTGGIVHYGRNISGTIYNVAGKPVLKVSLTDRSEIGSLSPGIYIFRPDQGEPQRFVVAGN